jgi:LmbE family N-acetylglucosaminyl deacetylase
MAIMAHPDDEAIACGALLQVVREPYVVIATDGAPADPYFWREFGSRANYAEIREDETLAGLAALGITEVLFLRSRQRYPHEFADQRLYTVLERAYEELRAHAEQVKPQAIFTLAYEGGHPDHDCCAYLGARLARALGVPAFDAPLYNRAPGTLQYQQWPQTADEDVEFEVDERLMERKRKMMAEYPSQAHVVAQFNPLVERIRRQPEYDFTRPPHEGTLNYEAWGWTMTGADLVRAFAQCDQSIAAIEGGGAAALRSKRADKSE